MNARNKLIRGLRFAGAVALVLVSLRVHAQEAVTVAADWVEVDGARVVAVHFGIPETFHVYAGRIAVTSASPVTLTARDIPPSKEIADPVTESTVQVYDHDVTFTYGVDPPDVAELDLIVKFQACDEAICYLPAKRAIRVGGGAGAVEKEVPATADVVTPVAGEWRELMQGFRIAGSASGYVKAPEFLNFLERAARGDAVQKGAIREAFDRRGIWAAGLLILLGGLLLNLTPCVLPMIPVNIAIIGAGAAAGSRGRGLALGTAYGIGIALVYGVLGLVVVLTGASFGTLNASPWFNLVIGAVFLVLALGMFDVFLIDLSRFQTRLGTGGNRGTLLTALVLGGIAALLAGACVAPAVIGVIVLATDLYARGQRAGLLLPFLLGVGMALPWPLAGAGLSFLPKPGRWMETIKVGFGVVILLAALYYGWTGVSLLRDRSASQRAEVEALQSAHAGSDWSTSLEQGLALAQREGRPVLIDFWASWCKNCLHMEKTTFQDAAVRARLNDFVKIKYRAEDPTDPETRSVQERFGVIGLPTYIVLLPEPATR